MKWRIFTTKLLRSYAEYEVEADTEDEAITKWDNYDYTEISDSEPEIEDEMFEECTLVTEPEITDEMTAATYNVT